MRADWPELGDTVLRVDGGMAASDCTMQFLSDILGAAVDRPEGLETTARGAAWLAGMQAGIYPHRHGFAKIWALERRFRPALVSSERDAAYARWRRAIPATLVFAEQEQR